MARKFTVQSTIQTIQLQTVYCSFLNKGDPLVPCKKRQLRGEKREKTGNELGEGSVDVYLSNQRRLYQEEGSSEPPIVPNIQTLKNLKHERKIAQYADEDPVKSLFLLKNSPRGKNVIHEIGLDPFFIHVMSAHQIRLWNNFCNRYPLQSSLNCVHIIIY